MTSFSKKRAIFLSFILFVGGLLAGSFTGSAAIARAQDPYATLDVFARILNTIESDYLEPVTTEQLVDAAIKGMVNELDPHTKWLDPDQVRRLRQETDGEYSGIGIEIDLDDHGAAVTRVFPNSPAQRDGIAKGDLITSINGSELNGLTIDELKERFIGPRGSEAFLVIQRVGSLQPLELVTTRDKVRIPAVESHFVAPDIAYIRVIQFQEGTTRELQKSYNQLAKSHEINGLILDLRDNLGGLLVEAVAVADLFIYDGVMVSTRSRVQGEEVFRATADGLPQELKIIALTNRMSASAAEIVAGALQDTKRGRLIGERTYGKGSVQSIYTNSDDSALKLTIGEYFTPSGKPVAPKEGRKPDIEVLSKQQRGPRDELRRRLHHLDLSAAKLAELLVILDQIPADSSPIPIEWNKDFESRRTEPQLARAISELSR